MAFAQALESQPGAGDGLSIPQLATFASLVSCLREKISWHQSLSSSCAPLILPDDITTFCAEALGIDANIVTNAWGLLRDILWTPPHDDLLDETSILVRNGGLLRLFLEPDSNTKLVRLGSPIVLGYCTNHVCISRSS